MFALLCMGVVGVSNAYVVIMKEKKYKKIRTVCIIHENQSSCPGIILNTLTLKHRI